MNLHFILEMTTTMIKMIGEKLMRCIIKMGILVPLIERF